MSIYAPFFFVADPRTLTCPTKVKGQPNYTMFFALNTLASSSFDQPLTVLPLQYSVKGESITN